MNFVKEKYHDLYWNLAINAASQSNANRLKVGAVIVAPTGMISIGWNGTPPGFSNECEDTESGKTLPWVIHAERNALDKMTRQGVSVEGSTIFITHTPCIECAKSLYSVGIKEVYVREPYGDTLGIDFLNTAGVTVKMDSSFDWEVEGG